MTSQAATYGVLQQLLPGEEQAMLEVVLAGMDSIADHPRFHGEAGMLAQCIQNRAQQTDVDNF